MIDKYNIDQYKGIEGQKGIKKGLNKIEKDLNEKAEKIRKYRKEASRLSAMANKRIARLEKNNLTDSPAYQKYLESGGEKFGIKGKTYNEVQQEMARLRNFINSETSTVRGVNKVLKDMASNTGIKYENMKELRQSSKVFFELASKVEQYLRTVDDMASAIGYQKIWQAINKYTQTEKIELSKGIKDVEKLTEKVVGALKEYEEEKFINERDGLGGLSGWYSLK